MRKILAVFLLLAICVFAVTFGRYPKPGFINIMSIMEDEIALKIIFLVRLPRIAAALLLGAVLGASGSAMQYVFANPLVDAGFLGVSQGASFGAALAILTSLGPMNMFFLAFAFAILALGFSVLLSSQLRFGGAVLRLLLSGMAVSAFFSAMVALLKYGADPVKELPELTYWLMGGLSAIKWASLSIVAPLAVMSLVALLLLRWRILLLSMDEASAISIGINTRLERAIVLFVSAAGVAAVTAMAGVVSWVGLIVPHAARLFFGKDDSNTMIGAALFGAVFVLFCDTLSRSIFPGELPLGISTSLFGTMIFVSMLIKRRVRVERG